MIVLLTLLWPALVASFVLGAACGWLAGLPHTRAARAGSAILALTALGTAGVAVAGIVPGRAGLWVEGGALALGAYLAGAIVGAGIATARRRPSVA